MTLLFIVFLFRPKEEYNLVFTIHNNVLSQLGFSALTQFKATYGRLCSGCDQYAALSMFFRLELLCKQEGSPLYYVDSFLILGFLMY